MAEYPYFPAFVNLSKRRIVVIGGGRIAARRVGTLAGFCPGVTVIAPQVHPDILALVAAGRLTVLQRPYADGDLEGADVALACTDDAGLNAEIAAACKARGIPVNVASDRTLCDFLFPGVAQNGSVVVGVTAGGKDHALARRVTEEIREYLKDVD